MAIFVIFKELKRTKGLLSQVLDELHSKPAPPPPPPPSSRPIPIPTEPFSFTLPDIKEEEPSAAVVEEEEPSAAVVEEVEEQEEPVEEEVQEEKKPTRGRRKKAI
jgi:hypothetical protein